VSLGSTDLNSSNSFNSLAERSLHLGDNLQDSDLVALDSQQRRAGEPFKRPRDAGQLERAGLSHDQIATTMDPPTGDADARDRADAADRRNFSRRPLIASPQSCNGKGWIR
jgi:hypothetical protein